MTQVGSPFDEVRLVSDAVLYEGYLLYPYRASSDKNRVRFQFGVIAPRPFAERDGSERWSLSTGCVVEYDTGTHLDVRVRFLHMRPSTADASAFDEAIEASVDVTGLRLDGPVDHAESFDVAGVVGRIVVRAEPVPGPYPLTQVHVAVENLADWDDAGAGRDDLLHHCLLSTQALLAVDGGAFVSSIDPPAFARAAVQGCTPGGLWPVLGGPADRHDVMLCLPIILSDHPETAPESSTEFCDATEIDEMLAIRVLTLTDDEKREARATDPRAREIIDSWGDFPPEMIERLHGSVRSLRSSDEDADPSRDVALVRGVEVKQGDKVRVHPLGRSDAQDMFLEGRVATVTGVFHDLDDDTHVAVVLNDDPGADLHEWYGRYLYFKPDELEAEGLR